MKLLLFSILVSCALPLTAQETEHVRIGKDTVGVVMSFFPHIDKFYEGEIPVEYLGDSDGIQVVEGWKVISFSISYPFGNQNKVVPVKGNTIPAEIIRDIYVNSLGEMIFITNIVILNAENRRMHLVPMTLVPVR